MFSHILSMAYLVMEGLQHLNQNEINILKKELVNITCNLYNINVRTTMLFLTFNESNRF